MLYARWQQGLTSPLPSVILGQYLGGVAMLQDSWGKLQLRLMVTLKHIKTKDLENIDEN